MVRHPKCKAHLECTLESITHLGEEMVIFGRIVAASIDSDCQTSRLADQYSRLRPLFFLENGVYGSIDTAKRIRAPWPTEQSLTVVELHNPPGNWDVEAHVAYLRSLRDTGVLVMAGPYEGRDPSRPSGMLLLASSEEEAHEIAKADPLVRGGATSVVRRWTRTF